VLHLRVRWFELARVEHVQVQARGDLAADDRASRGADDQFGRGQVNARVAQAFEQAGFPGNTRNPAAAQNQRE
jgi:hypothetical protein